jgi:hypothetical protein
MAQPFKSPEANTKAFNCPHCHAFAQQHWFELKRATSVGYADTPFEASRCTNCGEWLYWYNEAIVVPDVSSAPPANDDLNGDIKKDYAEAASIVAKSPRGAAALLRLCLQKLCKQLGEEGKNIDRDIGSLVSKGLDIRVQQALDIVRVIGNESVHPGEIDLRDNPETAGMLFTLVNAIADQMITQPKLRDDLYKRLPQAKLDGIAARNAKARSTGEKK